MTSFVVDELGVPWEASSALWSLAAAPSADALGRGGSGMAIQSAAGAASDPAPSAERRFTPPLDLRGADELRLWLRSSRPGDGRPDRPFYLAFEAATDPPGAGAPWRRFLPVSQPDAWTLHRLWLGDMSAALRQAVGFLRLQSLDPTVAFDAALDDVLAVRPEPIGDVQAALLARLADAVDASVILDVPENPGTRTRPFVLVTPWSVVPLERRTGADEITDNYTDTGAFVRPAPASLQLEYRVDVFAEDGAEKARLLEAIVGAFLSDARLVVANVPVALLPFVPLDEEATAAATGRTPLFVRLTTDVETGRRRLLGFAVPFLLAGPADGRETAEVAPV
jgi:hypothetical protein